MKIRLLVISLFASFLLNAQIKKGAFFIGGDVSVYASDYTTTNPNPYTSQNNSYNFSPSVGWVIKDNMIVGGRLLVSFYNFEQQNNPGYDKGNRIGAGIWMRKYLPLGKSFYLFGDAGLNAQSIYRKQSQVQQPYNYKEKGYAISASLFPGISYQIKKSLFLELALNNLITLGYERRNTKELTQNGSYYKGVSNNYNLSSTLGSGVPLQIGLRWIIAKK